jgi:hypothetical protein
MEKFVGKMRILVSGRLIIGEKKLDLKTSI